MLSSLICRSIVNCAISCEQKSRPKYFADSCICSKTELLLPQPLLKVKSAKTGIILRRVELLNLYFYRCCRQFFRLLGNILILAKAIPTTPYHIVCGKYFSHFGIINVKNISISFYTTDFLGIPIRNTKPAPLKVYKAVKRNFSFWS